MRAESGLSVWGPGGYGLQLLHASSGCLYMPEKVLAFLSTLWMVHDYDGWQKCEVIGMRGDQKKRKDEREGMREHSRA